MTVRHVLSLSELGPKILSHLVERGIAMAALDGASRRPLSGKIVGIYFRGPSTRTRTSFTVAALRLGAQIVSYGPQDLQLSTGETLQDTSRVLSGYLDALVIRTNETVEEMRTLARQERMAVVNAMSDNEHPTQAVADLITMREAFGRLDGLHVLYLGEGNNTAAALALAVALTPGMRLTLVTPQGYGLPVGLLESAAHLARQNHSQVEQHHLADELPEAVDVVYATRWNTMGAPKSDALWPEKFVPFSVTQALMERVSKPTRTFFMHDLPAVRGDDVTDEVLDGPQSLAFRQAQHKLSGAMAILEWCLAAS